MANGVQDAVRVTRAGGGRAPLVIVCEHASAYIPPEFGDLGLSAEARHAHIAWDPGALGVATALSEALDAVLVAGGISRLVYDCNRPPDAADAIPARSEAYDIPGNASLTSDARAHRVARVYVPFRDAVAAEMSRHTAPILVTVHSFTPIYYGVRRETELGVLHDADARLADAMLAAPGAPHQVTRNAPYGPEDGVTHTLQVHALSRDALNVMIEIRSDLIETSTQQVEMGRALAQWIATALADLNAHPAKGASTCGA